MVLEHVERAEGDISEEAKHRTTLISLEEVLAKLRRTAEKKIKDLERYVKRLSSEIPTRYGSMQLVPEFSAKPVDEHPNQLDVSFVQRQYRVSLEIASFKKGRSTGFCLKAGVALHFQGGDKEWNGLTSVRYLNADGEVFLSLEAIAHEKDREPALIELLIDAIMADDQKAG